MFINFHNMAITIKLKWVMVSHYKKLTFHDITFVAYPSHVVHKNGLAVWNRTSKFILNYCYFLFCKAAYVGGSLFSPFFLLAAFKFKFFAVVFTLRRFEDMKHYAENLGSNVGAMIKVRQVDYPL